MNRGEQTLKLIDKWVKRVGAAKAKARLAATGEIGLSTAEKLVRGAYESIPGHDLTESILRELAKDGISLAGEVAS